MLELKFNKENITRKELNQIEKRYKKYLKEGNNTTPKFNVLNLCRTDVYAHVLSIFIRLEIHQVLELSISQLLDFLIDVANKYTEAPYHTFYHAADIVTMLYYLCNDLSADKYLTNLDITFLMIAALCHDIGHPGLNNTFQNNLKTNLFFQYGEKSILEAYSVDLTIELIKKHQITKPKMNEIIKDLILSTDMEYHNELVEQTNALISNKTNDRLSISRILLHTADISNMARPWLISKQWSDLIIKEFFNQGDEERKRKMKISVGMDRRISCQKNISLKFGEIILPFFKSLVYLLPKSHVLVDYLKLNRIEWERTANKRSIRRVSNDIIIQPQATAATAIKRIRLGFRSRSYPTVLYHQTTTCNTIKSISTTPRKSSLATIPNNLLPFINFKLFSNNIETTTCTTIVLYHPYDQ